MEMPLPEILDRMSILKLKIERIWEHYLLEEVKAYEKALKEFEENGVGIKEEWINELYKINSEIWGLESDIRKDKDGDLD